MIDIIAIAILAVISGADSWVAIETYSKSKREWLETFLTYPTVFPPMTRLQEYLRLLNTQAFEQCFHQWVESISEAISAQVIPIDGKTVRQSFEESDFFRGRWDWQCGKMTQCQILSNNLSSTS